MGSDFTALFCFVDDFIASFEKEGKATISGNLRRGAKPKLNLSEVVTIIISYHLSSYDCFKNYYIKKVLKDHIRDFDLVSYQQFIKLIPRSITVVAALLKLLLGKCNGTSFVDSTSIAVCKNYRISRHKTFSGLGARGKTTKGWFFGFKLHLIINSAGDLIKVRFTAGNKDDRKALADMTAGLFGKMCGDRGYISKDLCDKL